VNCKACGRGEQGLALYLGSLFYRGTVLLRRTSFLICDADWQVTLPNDGNQGPRTIPGTVPGGGLPSGLLLRAVYCTKRFRRVRDFGHPAWPCKRTDSAAVHSSQGVATRSASSEPKSPPFFCPRCRGGDEHHRPSGAQYAPRCVERSRKA